MGLFYLVWILWLVIEVFLLRNKKAVKANKNETDKGSLNILWLSVLFGISVGIMSMWHYPVLISKSMLIPYLGLLLILIGVIIRFWAIKSLGEAFSVDVNITKHQKLKTNGLYKKIRHPAYAGLILAFLGLGLSFNNYLSVIAILIPIIAGILYRIKVEEQVLVDFFGDEYIEYMKKTKKLIPGIF